MKQKIVMIAENNKDVSEVLKTHGVTLAQFNEKSKQAWEILASLMTLTDKSGDKLTIETVETLTDM